MGGTGVEVPERREQRYLLRFCPSRWSGTLTRGVCGQAVLQCAVVPVARCSARSFRQLPVSKDEVGRALPRMLDGYLAVVVGPGRRRAGAFLAECGVAGARPTRRAARNSIARSLRPHTSAGHNGDGAKGHRHGRAEKRSD